MSGRPRKYRPGSIALLMIGDGREEYHRAADASIERSFEQALFDQLIKVDDSAHELGFHGAIQKGWDQVETDYVFHVEMDFTFNFAVPLELMRLTLEERKYLTQIALLRQPCNPEEDAAGGVIQRYPDGCFSQVELVDGRAWIEHRQFWTTNPSLYPRWIVDRGWPQIEGSEGKFAIDLFEEDPARCAAYWGHGEQWVKHIGDSRDGHGY